MPTQRLSMRRIKEVLRLKHVQGLPERAIARTVGVSNGVVHGYLSRARAAGLSWPLPDGMTDEDPEFLLCPAPKAASQSPLRPVPDWSHVDKELRRRNMTRRLLWMRDGYVVFPQHDGNFSGDESNRSTGTAREVEACRRTSG